MTEIPTQWITEEGGGDDTGKKSEKVAEQPEGKVMVLKEGGEKQFEMKTVSEEADRDGSDGKIIQKEANQGGFERKIIQKEDDLDGFEAKREAKEEADHDGEGERQMKKVNILDFWTDSLQFPISCYSFPFPKVEFLKILYLLKC